jgi:streptogramin lyase
MTDVKQLGGYAMASIFSCRGSAELSATGKLTTRGSERTTSGMCSAWTAASLFCVVSLSGCVGTPPAITTGAALTPGIGFHGRVHGGQQPIAGASVYLFAAGTGGYGNGSQSLLTSGAGKDALGDYYVTTGPDGLFTIAGDYTCPSGSAQVYVYSIGGDSGGGLNPAIALMAATGACDSLTSSTFVFVNEVSTVASAYALAGYATDPTHISSSASTLAQKGVANAFASVTNLETLSTGVALAATPASNGAVPQAEINTLADILAGCINSSGSGSTGCSTLFSNAMNGDTAPSDTATAAINIAHNPGANVAALYALATASAPFQPTLSGQPNDFTIAINYSGGCLVEPYQIAIDGSGDVWETDSSSVCGLNALGSSISGQSGYTGGGLESPGAVAIDGSGNIWVTNSVSSITEFSPSGSPLSASGYTGGGLNKPDAIAVDKFGDAWAANSTNSISEFNSSGSPLSGSGYAGGGLNTPDAIAIDASGNVWVANSSGNSISEFNSSGLPISGSTGFTGGGLNGPDSIAIDASGDAWLANVDANSISEFGSGGSPISGLNGFTGGGLDGPDAIAVDGSGAIWTASGDFNATCPYNTISEFAASGIAISGQNGYCYSAPGYYFQYLAIDGSGNVWVTTQGSILEFVGVATPVVTPIVANLMPPYGQYAVNKP